MLTSIIVDDERKARETLNKVVSTHLPEVEVLAMAENVEEAIALIGKLQPDVVFLDVEMPGQNGFDLLGHFKEIPFEVIFTTAYDHYAIQAIKFAAIDYLLKPITPAELKKAVARVEESRQQKSGAHQQVEALLENIKETGRLKKLIVPDAKGMEVVPLPDIIRLESDGSYSSIHLSNGKKIVSTKALKEYESLLESQYFFRIHHSHIVNLHHVVRYEKKDNGYAIMSDKSEIEISRRRKAEFLAQLAAL